MTINRMLFKKNGPVPAADAGTDVRELTYMRSALAFELYASRAHTALSSMGPMQCKSLLCGLPTKDVHREIYYLDASCSLRLLCETCVLCMLVQAHTLGLTHALQPCSSYLGHKPLEVSALAAPHRILSIVHHEQHGTVTSFAARC